MEDLMAENASYAHSPSADSGRDCWTTATARRFIACRYGADPRTVSQDPVLKTKRNLFERAKHDVAK
jgi:hypothetical protein